MHNRMLTKTQKSVEKTQTNCILYLLILLYCAVRILMKIRITLMNVVLHPRKEGKKKHEMSFPLDAEDEDTSLLDRALAFLWAQKRDVI